MPSNDKEESRLHPKHRQALLSAYNDADWLYRTLSDNQYIKAPSHLKRIKTTLRNVLTDLELLEHLYICTHCEHKAWKSEVPITGRQTCPDCNKDLEFANTRTVDGSETE